MNCCVAPASILAVAGEIVIEVRFAAVTVMVAVPDFPPEVAVTVAVPAATPVAKPPLEIVATVESLEDQDAELVRSFVVLSL
jgi:hypothetical protein